MILGVITWVSLAISIISFLGLANQIRLDRQKTDARATLKATRGATETFDLLSADQIKALAELLGQIDKLGPKALLLLCAAFFMAAAIYAGDKHDFRLHCESHPQAVGCVAPAPEPAKPAT